MIELYPFQQRGVEFLSGVNAGLLADQMGLGKTIQVIKASSFRTDILYMCPASLCENVRREFSKAGRDAVVVRGAKAEIPKAGIVVVSYDTLKINTVFAQLDHRWHIIICDESHLLKSPKSKRAQAVFGNRDHPGLARNAEKVWLMTGTPVMSHVGELWTALQALRPDIVNGRSYHKWLFDYCDVSQHPRFGLKILGHKKEEVAELRRQLEENFMLRRLKRDVLPDLPELRVEPLYISVDLDEPENVDDLIFEQALLEMIDGGRVTPTTSSMVDPDLQDMEQCIATLRRRTEVAKVTEIVRVVESDLQSGVDKLIIFAQHHETLDALSQALAAYDPVRLDGRMTPSVRQRSVDHFHEGLSRIFLGQTQAAGVGLTLHANGRCSDVLFCSLDFTPAINRQAMMRIHRIGQPNACLVRYAVASGTFDERVNEIIAKKTRRVLDLVEDDV